MNEPLRNESYNENLVFVSNNSQGSNVNIVFLSERRVSTSRHSRSHTNAIFSKEKTTIWTQFYSVLFFPFIDALATHKQIYGYKDSEVIIAAYIRSTTEYDPLHG